VVLKPVTIARDLGAVIEIASGLAADDHVIQNPPDGIATGAVVNVVAKPTAGVARDKPQAQSEHG
jgi:hypothetical protein